MIIYSSSTATSNSTIFRLRILLLFQRFSHTVPVVEGQAKRYSDAGHGQSPGNVVSSSWALDTRKIGIDRKKIPLSPSIVLKVLKEQGFDAYLVGGCVRDLLLHKVPKDYDVITTANLSKVRNIFHHCQIVGRRFPICRVHVKGSVVEVSSFETVAKEAKKKREFILPQMPREHDKKDVLRWTNCMHRDFTVNSLFFNPLTERMYDYTNALSDLRSSKLRTLIPAQKSFQEDCARILRGLRLAARLNFSFSKEIENAIHRLGPSIQSLSQSRILMELDYMLSYGAAEPSLKLLHRFRLLDILLPIQAAYLSQQASTTSGKNSSMLMKLLANLDQLVSCDRPAHGCMWVSLFAFHQTLIINPQQALVVTAFASVLYHDNWEKGVQFARQHAKSMHSYVPEISDCLDSISDDELFKKLSQFGVSLRDSVNALTGSDDLKKTMARFPEYTCSGLQVFVSKKMGKDANQIFQIREKSLNRRRKNEKINYDLLGKGDINEARFVLGKIIVNTLSGFVQDDVIKHEKDEHPPTKKDRSTKKQLSESEHEQKVPEKKKKKKKISKDTNLSEGGRRNFKEKDVCDSKRKELVKNDNNSWIVMDGSGVGIGCVLEKQNAEKTQENVEEERHHLPSDSSSSSCLEQSHVAAGSACKKDESKKSVKEKNENKIVQKNRQVKLSRLF